MTSPGAPLRFATAFPAFVGTFWRDPATGETHLYLHANSSGVLPSAVLVALGSAVAQVAQLDPSAALPVGAPNLPLPIQQAVERARAAALEGASPSP